MKTRILSSVVVIAVLVAVLWIGGNVLVGAALVASLIGLREFYRAYSGQLNPMPEVGYFLATLLYLGSFFGFQEQFIPFLMVTGLFLVLGISVFSRHKVLDSMVTFIGFLYIPFCLYHILKIDAGFAMPYIWLPFIISVSSDTFAYVVGKLIGKHQLIPAISPGKTIEGSMGGILFTMIFTPLYCFLFIPDMVLVSIPLAFIGSILAQIGDLIASRIKRDCDIKDFGKLIPGHGGIVDRLDSLLIMFPFVYYYFQMILFIQNG